MFGFNNNSEDPDFWSSKKDPGPSYHNADWMKRVPDSRLLSELSIPGTHNTMSDRFAKFASFFKRFFTAPWVCCQSWDLRIQLNMGVRFLDTRCRAFDGGMALHHDNFYLHGNLKDALTKIKNFLQTNKHECIILRIKQEKSKLPGFEFRNALKPILNEFSTHILQTKSMPTLGEARGKMVILADFEIDQEDNMMHFRNMMVRDNWNPDSESEKITGIKANIQNAACHLHGRDKMYITFTNYLSEFNAVFDLARRLNRQVQTLVKEHKGCLGIIVMDFPGYEVLRDIISHN